MTPAKARAALDRARRLLDAPPPEQVPGQAAMDVRTEDKPPPSCDTGNPRCGALDVHFYAAGYRCDDHRPHAYRPE
ncbi:aromatic ring-opening dioxygenase LigA [Streptomyces sp. B21-097]|uniref:aromatic ring-opening dioxygenase LigA n=1 Tax=Streptomyces sp. B21-097 TaxID=3039414 RepID=UPI002FF05ED9